jgi:hypothetical protein
MQLVEEFLPRDLARELQKGFETLRAALQSLQVVSALLLSKPQ